MIAEPYQKLGFGREALVQVIHYLKEKDTHAFIIAVVKGRKPI